MALSIWAAFTAVKQSISRKQEKVERPYRKGIEGVDIGQNSKTTKPGVVQV